MSNRAWKDIVTLFFPTPTVEQNRTALPLLRGDPSFSIDLYIVVVEASRIEMLDALRGFPEQPASFISCTCLTSMLRELSDKQVDMVAFLSDKIFYATRSSFLAFLLQCTTVFRVFDMPRFLALFKTVEREGSEVGSPLLLAAEMTYERAAVLLAALSTVEIAAVDAGNVRCAWCGVDRDADVPDEAQFAVTFPFAGEDVVHPECMVKWVEATEAVVAIL